MASLKELRPDLAVYMMDLLSESDSQAPKYAEQFHPSFKTIAKHNELLQELGVWYQKTQKDDQPVSHSDRVYLIEFIDHNYALINQYAGSSPELNSHLQYTIQRHTQP